MHVICCKPIHLTKKLVVWLVGYFIRINCNCIQTTNCSNDFLPTEINITFTVNHSYFLLWFLVTEWLNEWFCPLNVQSLVVCVCAGIGTKREKISLFEHFSPVWKKENCSTSSEYPNDLLAYHLLWTNYKHPPAHLPTYTQTNQPTNHLIKNVKWTF